MRLLRKISIYFIYPVSFMMLGFWLNMEAHGGSWRVEGKVGNVFCRISFMTGSSTIAGWHHHEWLWKNDVEALNVRRDDVEAIYTCADKELGLFLLEEYDVDYIYVGRLEYEKYKTDEGYSLLDYEYLRSLGDVVYEGESISPKYETFLVKIK